MKCTGCGKRFSAAHSTGFLGGTDPPGWLLFGSAFASIAGGVCFVVFFRHLSDSLYLLVAGIPLALAFPASLPAVFEARSICERYGSGNCPTCGTRNSVHPWSG